MYNDTSPATLYEEYEIRVAKAVQNSRRAVDAQSASRPTGLAWTAFRARLSELRDRIERQLQPAEAGYIA